jgi:hypothetical protein
MGRRPDRIGPSISQRSGGYSGRAALNCRHNAFWGHRRICFQTHAKTKNKGFGPLCDAESRIAHRLSVNLRPGIGPLKGERSTIAPEQLSQYLNRLPTLNK